MKSTLLSLLNRIDLNHDGRQARPPSDPKRFLFLQYESALGSAIHGTPIFQAIKSAAGDTFVAVACSGLTYDVLRYNAYIDELFVTRHPLRNFFGALQDFWCLRVKLRSFDRAITDCSNTRTKIALMAWLTGVKSRFGFTLAPEIYNRTIEYKHELSVIENNLRMLSLLDFPQRHFEPFVGFSNIELSRIRSILGVELFDGRPILAFVTQTSGGHRKNWRDKRFAELADRFVARQKCHIVFVGTAVESTGIERIRKLMKFNSVSVAGETNIPELAALLSTCDLCVALDTGPMHVARAVRLPGVVIAPGWLPSHEWLPLDHDLFTVIVGSKSGTEKSQPSVPLSYIDDIEVSDVAEKVFQMLERYPPSVEARRSRVSRNLCSPVRAVFAYSQFRGSGSANSQG
jgi:ADP-heptose:LPS heptosyltransferase